MEDKKIVKVDVSGKDDVLFENLRAKLINTFDEILDTTINIETGESIRDETKKLASLALNFAESKLKKASIENYQLIADIDEKYSNIELIKAKSRKINAESKQIEFEQKLRKLKLSLKIGKAMIFGREGEEAILLTKQFDLFLEALNDIEASRNFHD